MTHEGYLYALDSLPLLLSISVFVVVWPPRVMNESSPYFEGSDSETRQVRLGAVGGLSPESSLQELK